MQIITPVTKEGMAYCGPDHGLTLVFFNTLPLPNLAETSASFRGRQGQHRGGGLRSCSREMEQRPGRRSSRRPPCRCGLSKGMRVTSGVPRQPAERFARVLEGLAR